MTLGLVAREVPTSSRSHTWCRPVKRLPSKPWSAPHRARMFGRGPADAQNVFDGGAPPAVLLRMPSASIITAALAAAFSQSFRYASWKSLLTFSDLFLCNGMQRLSNELPVPPNCY